jgi:hypothetical protein
VDYVKAHSRDGQNSKYPIAGRSAHGGGGGKVEVRDVLRQEPALRGIAVVVVAVVGDEWP